MNSLDTALKSPSAGGRGLKLNYWHMARDFDASPSAGGRGLKLLLVVFLIINLEVALRRRAWIETSPFPSSSWSSCVALRRRAWIETKKAEHAAYKENVALRRRAWIETIQARRMLAKFGKSPSAGGRGLKRPRATLSWSWMRSPSAGGRGLKHLQTLPLQNIHRRPPQEGVD